MRSALRTRKELLAPGEVKDVQLVRPDPCDGFAARAEGGLVDGLARPVVGESSDRTPVGLDNPEVAADSVPREGVVAAGVDQEGFAARRPGEDPDPAGGQDVLAAEGGYDPHAFRAWSRNDDRAAGDRRDAERLLLDRGCNQPAVRRSKGPCYVRHGRP